MPSGTLEEVDELLDLLVGNDTVEALPVGIDHPHHVAEPLERRIGDRLPDVALIQLSVPGEGDEAGGVLLAAVEVGVDVAPHGRREQRGHHPEADRTRREVGDVRIFRAARVGLQAAERSEPGQIRPVEFAGQVLDRVVDG